MTTPHALACGFSRQLCGTPLAYVAKAVSRPKSSLMHDHRGSNVSVQNRAAFAGMGSSREGFCFDRPALRAGLRSAARIDQYDISTSVCSFVLNKLDKDGPRGVVNGPGEHTFLQPSHIKVFKRNPLIARDQGVRELVKVIPPLTSDFGRSSSKSRFGFEATITASLAAAKGTLTPTLCFLSLAGEARRLNNFFVASSDQAVQSKVNPNRASAARLRKIRLDGKHHVPLTLLASQDRSAKPGIWRQIAVPDDFDTARYADEAEAQVFPDRQSIVDPERGTVEARRGSKSREAVSAAEERHVGLIKPTQHLLQGSEGPATESVRISGAACLQFGSLMSITQAQTAAPIGLNSLLQTSVVKATHVTKHFIKQLSLRSVGPKSIFVAKNKHAVSIQRGAESATAFASVWLAVSLMADGMPGARS